MLIIKILISGPKFHGYNNSIGRAFEDFDYNVELSEWPNMSKDLFYQTKLLLLKKMNKIRSDQKLQKFKLKEMKNKIIQYNKKLFYQIKETNPDILLVLKGDIILPKTIKKVREKTQVISVMWCYDRAVRYPNVVEGGKYYNLFYVFEPSDKKELQKYGIESKFLPLAYDPNSYYKKNDKTPNIDISFVGEMHQNRKKILEKLIRYNENLEIEYWGEAWTWYNPFLQYEYKIKRRALGKHIHNYNISHEEINDIYNSTKICLNIHHPQSKEGLNPRTFEILGANGFELVDYKIVLEELFELEKEIICYRNEKELFEKIDYYLNNKKERKKIAERGYKRVRREHTFKHRVGSILKSYEELSQSI